MEHIQDCHLSYTRPSLVPSPLHVQYIFSQVGDNDELARDEMKLGEEMWFKTLSQRPHFSGLVQEDYSQRRSQEPTKRKTWT